MKSLARDALTVFSAGNEVPGLIAYGLTARGAWQPTAFPLSAWPTSTTFDEFALHGEGWEIIAWELALAAWPGGDEWTRAVRETLGALIDGGCRVAWVGAEGIPFCDPPELFGANCMSGGVLAWMTHESFECPLDPDRPLAPVDDAVLTTLRRYARGLADVP